MGHRLLVVDSDRNFLQEHKIALESAFDVDFRTSIEGALPRLEGGDYAAVLVSVEVSGNKGYSLCSAIRRNPALGELKMALISARASEEEYNRHRELPSHADIYLRKPIRPNQLISSLAAIVPPRPEDPDNPLGDLEGADLSGEWLENLKTELEEEPAPVPAHRPVTQPVPDFWTTRRLTPPVVPPVPKDAGRVELLEARVRDLETKLVGVSDDLEARQRELDALRRQDQEGQARTAGQEARIQELEAHLAEAGQAAEDLEARLAERTRQVQEMESWLGDQSGRVSELEALTAEDARRLEEAGRDLEALRQAEASARALAGEKAQMAMDLMESNQLLQAQVAEGREERERLAETGRDQEARLREAEAGRAAAEGRQAELESALEDLRGHLATVEENHQRQQVELLTAIDEREARLARLTAATDALREQVLALEQEKAAGQARAERMAAVADKIAGLEDLVRQALDLARDGAN